MNTNELNKQEYIICQSDIGYFIKHHVKIRHPIRGIIPFKLYGFQHTVIDDFIDFDSNIILKARQMGMSTLVAAYSLWLMLFHKNKNVFFGSDMRGVADEAFVNTIRFMHDNLPLWLQVKVKDFNKISLLFDNGSRITTGLPVGLTYSLLIIDECAFIPDIDEIFSAVYPALATNGQSIIISTPNGVGNFFHKTWEDAKAKKNDFNCIKLPWDLHPDRDESWRIAQNEELGNNIKKAAQECDCAFVV